MSQRSCNFHATPTSWVTFKMPYTLEIWIWIPKRMCFFSKNLAFQTYMAILGFPPPTGSSECHQPFQRIAVASMAGPLRNLLQQRSTSCLPWFFLSWKMWGKIRETRTFPNSCRLRSWNKKSYLFCWEQNQRIAALWWPLGDKLGKDMIRIWPQDFLQNVRYIILTIFSISNWYLRLSRKLRWPWKIHLYISVHICIWI